jgi:probable phosphoglycerate mutase
MRTRIILIRHGETADTVERRYSGHRQTSLTARGQAQAQRAGAQLARTCRIDALYASPIKRAWETATIIGKAVGCLPRPDPRLREQSFGEAEGLTGDEIAAKMPQVYAASRAERGPEFCWPGGNESWGEFRARARDAFEEIVAQHAGHTIGIVSHGPVIATVLQSVAGDDNFWPILDAGHMVAVDVTPAERSFRLVEGSRFLG